MNEKKLPPPSPVEYARARADSAEAWLETYRKGRFTLLEHAHLSEVGVRHLEMMIAAARALLPKDGDEGRAQGTARPANNTTEREIVVTPTIGVRRLTSGIPPLPEEDDVTDDIASTPWREKTGD